VVVPNDEYFDPFDQPASTPALRFTTAFSSSLQMSPPTHSTLTHTPLPVLALAAAIHVDLVSTVSCSKLNSRSLRQSRSGIRSGKKASANGDGALEAVGLKGRTEVQILGSAVEEVGDLRAAEDEKKRTEQILWNGETQTRVRQANSPSPAS
jgi:hypothetical protein